MNLQTPPCVYGTNNLIFLESFFPDVFTVLCNRYKIHLNLDTFTGKKKNIFQRLEYVFQTKHHFVFFYLRISCLFPCYLQFLCICVKFTNNFWVKIVSIQFLFQCESHTVCLRMENHYLYHSTIILFPVFHIFLWGFLLIIIYNHFVYLKWAPFILSFYCPFFFHFFFFYLALYISNPINSLNA